MLWVVTGDRDGSPAVLRFRQRERRWEVPGWVRRPEGIFGTDARGLRLRLIKADLWAVPSQVIPSTLYRFSGVQRVDEFRGQDMKLVSCARDLAESATGNLLLRSCENELQEVRVDGMDLALVATRPMVPNEDAADRWTDEIVVAHGARAIVALNIGAIMPSTRPTRARIIEVDSLGVARSLFDDADVVVRSMAVTPRSVIAVLFRGDGSADAVQLLRPR